jgi:hypothetical protein
VKLKEKVLYKSAVAMMICPKLILDLVDRASVSPLSSAVRGTRLGSKRVQTGPKELFEATNPY